jgi:hypothetical protein
VSVHNSIRESEAPSLARLDRLVEETQLPDEHPQQTLRYLPELLKNARTVKQAHYDPFFQNMQKKARDAHKRLKFFDSKLKGIWRCIEKMDLRQHPLDSCENICDIVRGAICSNSIAVLADVYQRLLNAPSIRIVRVKNRLKHANDSGWADCLINFIFVDDPTQHVCEVQLVHEKLMLVRKEMGAHESYSFFRSALELLEATDDTGVWAQECALVDLYNKCNGAGWVKHKNWCTGAPLHTWEGVTLDEGGNVSRLDLISNNLTGTLDENTRVRFYTLIENTVP